LNRFNNNITAPAIARKTITLFLGIILLTRTITSFYPSHSSFSLSIPKALALPDFEKENVNVIILI
jgi:hypothetical protein